ncbi:MAG TPA: RNA methyltransferase [Polyangiaceae bacterium]|jgi:tRNA (guanosine-2'-O-)-methyltransferase
MRRTTAGVVDADALLPARIARAEKHEPEDVIRVLEPLVLERRRERLLAVIDSRLASVTVLFDAPHDPFNGAAVVRSCEAFGVQTIHVVERRERFLAASSVARGAQKWVDIVRHPTSHEAVGALRESGMALVGAHPAGELLPEDLAKIPRLALVLGNERDGITAELEAACTHRVRVPMRGFVDSLNVSVTAAILLDRAVRERPGDLSEPERRRLYARGLYFSVQKAESILTLCDT